VASLVSAIALVAPGASPTADAAVHNTSPRPSLPHAAAQVRTQLRGIPQTGLTLGSSSAPVTVFEYADLVCGACAQAATNVLAPLIRRFVPTGRVAIRFEPIVEGPLSDQLTHGALAAGVQRHAWDYVQLAYLRSSPLRYGPAASPERLAHALGLHRRLWRRSLRRRRWASLIEQSARVALLGQFSSYPVFIVRSTPNVFGQRFLSVLRAPTSLRQLSSTVRKALNVTGP